MYRETVLNVAGRKLVIRSMQEKDTETVAKMEEAVFSQPWSRRSFQEMSARKDALFAVAEMDGEISGYCGVLYVWGEGDITNVAVRADRRGIGIGGNMLLTVMEWCRQDGIRAFTLEVRTSNHPAAALYEKLGFETEGIRKDFYAKPREDALIMWKRQETDGTITTKN